MPEAFERCREQGGKIRTVSGPDKQAGLAEDEYMHVCIDQSGQMFPGYKKKKQGAGPQGGLSRARASSSTYHKG